MGEPQDPYSGQPYEPPPYPPPYQAYSGYRGYSAPGRPRAGTTVAAAVLGFVAAGLLVLAATILFTSAGVADDLGNAFGSDTSSVTAELSIDAVLDLVAAGLLITGGVLLIGGNRRGLSFIAVGSGLVVAMTIYWIARAENGYTGVLFFGLLFAALVIVSVSLAYSPSSRTAIARMQT